jgi:hypothetical protein
MVEIPIELRKDGRNCGSHLRSLQDGLRHVRVIIFN